MSLTNHAVGIGRCTQSGMTIPSFISSEMHLGGFPDQTELQIWIVNFWTDDCSKAKSLARALQWIKEIEAAKSLDDLITPKSITGKNVTVYAELDVLMATELKRCYNEYPQIRRMIRATSSKGQPISQRQSECLFDLRNYRAWRRDKKGKQSFTERKAGEFFSGRHLGLVQGRIVVFYMRMPRDIVRPCEKWWRRWKISPGASTVFSTESFNSLKASPATRAGNSLLVDGKMKNRSEIIDITPCVVLNTLEKMHLRHSLLK